MKMISLIFGFVLLSDIASCQTKEAQEEVMILKGTYQGKNIFVHNPIFDDGFCANKVLLNGKEISAVINASAFEIRLDELSISEGEELEIRILHHPECRPKVLNPIAH